MPAESAREHECVTFAHAEDSGIRGVAPCASGHERARHRDRARPRIGHDVEDPGLELRAIVTLRDEVPDELVRELDRLADRHAGGG